MKSYGFLQFIGLFLLPFPPSRRIYIRLRVGERQFFPKSAYPLSSFVGQSDLKICLSPVKLCGAAVFGKTDILPPSLPPRGRGTASAGEGACESLAPYKVYLNALFDPHRREPVSPLSLPPRGRGTASAGEGACVSLTLD